MSSSPYLDTSALAKWFFVEAKSDAFERFMIDSGRAAVTPLARLELRSLIVRRLRSKEIDEAYAADVVSLFEELRVQRVLVVHPILDEDFVAAEGLIRRVADHAPLRTLDALHLAAAGRIGVRIFATADRALARAAKAANFDVVRFD
jgi:predicted nucleic acid-binding protein